MPVTINTVANYKVFRPVKTVRGTPPPPLTANLVVTTPPAGMSMHAAYSILAGHPCPMSHDLHHARRTWNDMCSVTT